MSITAISFYWRNDTPNFVTWRSRLATAPDTPTYIVIHGGQFTGGVHAPNQFVPVSHLPCSPALVRHTFLIVYFFNELISFIGSLEKCHTSVFNDGLWSRSSLKKKKGYKKKKKKKQENPKILIPKRGIVLCKKKKKNEFRVISLVCINSIFIVNIYFKFSNGRDMTKCYRFLHDDDKAVAIPQVFSENSRARNTTRAITWGKCTSIQPPLKYDEQTD